MILRTYQKGRIRTGIDGWKNITAPKTSSVICPVTFVSLSLVRFQRVQRLPISFQSSSPAMKEVQNKVIYCKKSRAPGRGRCLVKGKMMGSHKDLSTGNEER
jgi:hypothetical protein